MGCTLSRVVRDEEAPAALRPVQRKIDEIKRRNRLRMGSVSAVKLLHLVEPEEDDAPESLPKVVSTTVINPDQVDEEKGRKLGWSASDEEQLPGSPSFRYYCVEVGGDSDSDSFREPEHVNKINESKRQEDNPGQYQRKDINESQIPIIEEHSETKQAGRRFRGWFNVQNCYCSRSAMEVNGRDESPGMIIGKVV